MVFILLSARLISLCLILEQKIRCRQGGLIIIHVMIQYVIHLRLKTMVIGVTNSNQIIHWIVLMLLLLLVEVGMLEVAFEKYLELNFILMLAASLGAVVGLTPLFMLIASIGIRYYPKGAGWVFDFQYKNRQLSSFFSMVLFFPLMGLVMGIQVNFNNMTISVIDIMLLLVLHFVMILYLVIRSRLEQANVLETQLSYLDEYAHELQSSYQQIARYKEAMKESFEVGDQVESLPSMDGMHYKYMNLLQYIQDTVIKGIISSKLEMIINNDIQLVIGVDSEVPLFNLPDIDKARIFGILLDNAIEAALDSELKVIKLIFNSDESIQEISIVNSYKVKPDLLKINAVGYSTKGVGRGLGLSIVNRLTKKYKKLSWETRVDDCFFTQRLVIKRGHYAHIHY